MRTIKFRVWVGGEVMMSLSQAMHHDFVCIQHNRKDSFNIEPVFESDTLMQYTGLKDKNGVEIYESDVVEWLRLDIEKIEKGMIEWDKEYAGFGITGEHCLDWHHMLEVIGNIHENPELLESK